MKKAIIISCFGWYAERLIYIEEVLKGKGFSVEIYNSDFSHFKKNRVVKSNNCNYVHVPSYKKNLSLARLYSHVVFSYKLLQILKDKQPDFVYALVPPNSVAKACAAYKKKYRNTFLVYDIIDMCYTQRLINDKESNIVRLDRYESNSIKYYINYIYKI